MKHYCSSLLIISLVDTTSIAAVSAVHAASTSSLETGTPSERAPQLHQSARDLVTHGGMALVVVDWRGMSSTMSAGSLGSSCGGSSSGWGASSVSAALWAHQASPETRTSGGASSAGGAWSSSAATHERHDG